jgi:hypothetical protein
MTVAGSSSFYLPPQEKEVKFVAKKKMAILLKYKNIAHFPEQIIFGY